MHVYRSGGRGRNIFVFRRGGAGRLFSRISAVEENRRGKWGARRGEQARDSLALLNQRSFLYLPKFFRASSSFFSFLFSLDNFTTIHESRDQFVRTIRSERSQVLDYDTQFPYIYKFSPHFFSRLSGIYSLSWRDQRSSLFKISAAITFRETMTPDGWTIHELPTRTRTSLLPPPLPSDFAMLKYRLGEGEGIGTRRDI